LMKIGIEYISLFLNKCIKITKPRREPVYRLVKDPALKQASAPCSIGSKWRPWRSAVAIPGTLPEPAIKPPPKKFF
uniref:hypothetical protein n=1 Tax=Companilactobacillus furfuricola TaxID=1462575 RepID=UPI001B863465